MARFLTAALALLPAAASAFTSTPHTSHRPNTAFAAKNTHDPFRSAPVWTIRRNMAAYSDDFDAPIPANPQSGTTVMENAPVVDDECYLGANGQLDDCADFDPPKTRSVNAMDTPKGQKARDLPNWAKPYNDDFDAPIPANPQSGTTVMENAPVVDDECYLGANGQLDECADFDPPKTQSRAAFMAYNDDFDAPIPADPQSGTTVMENAPVVDDECYLGANGQLDECADFDPPVQANSWTNVMDTPRGQKARDLPNWAKKKS